MTNLSRLSRIAVLLGIVAPSRVSRSAAQDGPSAGKMPADLETRRSQLQSLFREEWQYELHQDPETATALGDNRYNDRLSDYSVAAFNSDIAEKGKFLGRFEAIDPTGFSSQDALSRTLMIRRLRQELEGARFKPWEMPVNQMSGPHLSLIELVTLTPFADAKDYDHYLSRLLSLPAAQTQILTVLSNTNAFACAGI